MFSLQRDDFLQERLRKDGLVLGKLPSPVHDRAIEVLARGDVLGDRVQGVLGCGFDQAGQGGERFCG